MMLYKRLETKMKRRIGLKAVSMDDVIIGTINDFNIEVIDEGTQDARLTVNYHINYGDYVRVVNENQVVLMK